LSSKETDKLMNFIEGVVGDRCLKIDEDLGNGFVRLHVSEAEKRQAKHDIRCVEDIVIELLRNSRDAGCKNIFVASYKEKNLRIITIIDDGCGIPPNLFARVFEPRVTSKLDTMITDRYGVHGRGMALYSVKRNIEDVNIIASSVEKGTIIKVCVDTKKCPERKDQSTFPITRVRRGEIQVVKGPHNVPRVLTEFGLEHPDIKIFSGSPAQILATMYNLSQNLLTSNKGGKTLFLENFEEGSLPLWQCVGLVFNVKVLAEILIDHYGLDVSLRNIHRIFNGEIKSLCDLRSALVDKHKMDGMITVSDINPNYETNLVKYIQKNDLDNLSKIAEEAFIKALGKKYFLSLRSSPKVWREKNQIKISFEVEEEDEL